jgi:hypothetical protein
MPPGIDIEIAFYLAIANRGGHPDTFRVTHLMKTTQRVCMNLNAGWKRTFRPANLNGVS